jgi:hypothetical protein
MQRICLRDGECSPPCTADVTGSGDIPCTQGNRSQWCPSARRRARSDHSTPVSGKQAHPTVVLEGGAHVHNGAVQLDGRRLRGDLPSPLRGIASAMVTLYVVLGPRARLAASPRRAPADRQILPFKKRVVERLRWCLQTSALAEGFVCVSPRSGQGTPRRSPRVACESLIQNYATRFNTQASLRVLDEEQEVAAPGCVVDDCGRRSIQCECKRRVIQRWGRRLF